MAARATFTGFDPYKLTGVRVTDRELGHGSYATVLELEYMGLKCAGKKIHELLLRQGDASYTVRRFEEECRLLSQVHHPNIVQFLGVYFQQGVRAPILVMEFLPTNLTSCIEQYGILPKEISYSILHDVALGLRYLHSQTPPIIHRDLSSNNVLLTPNMTAKISDLGVARILNLTPLQVSRMTQTPGTPAYMPPEVMVANPKYDTSVDEFSYGIMMIHMFSGQWPEPQVGQTRIEGGKLIPVTEAERREVFFKVIEDDHPLMDLIHRCINNDPQLRPNANEIVRRVSQTASQLPASFANRLEMLRRIEAVEEEKSALTEEGERKDRIIQQIEDEILISRREVQALTEEGERKDRVIQQKKSQISSLGEEVRAKEEQKSAEIDQLTLVHSSEVEQLRLQVRDLNTKGKLKEAENDAEVTELKSKFAALETQIENNAKILLQERERSARQQAEEQRKYEIQLKKEREQYEIQLTKEREANRKLIADCQDLRSDSSKSRSEIISLVDTNSKLQYDIAEKDAAILLKEASVKRKDSELEAKSRALEEKDATISAMSEQLTKSRECLVTKQQALQTSITWKQCTKLPFELSSAKATIINGKVYYGGGVTDDDDDYDDYIVHCYSLSQDRWTTLPRVPVKLFGLSQVNGELVAVGGLKDGNKSINEVYTYGKQSKKWKQTIPPMPTARYFPDVLSLQSALVVAGGYKSLFTGAVEIFKPDTSQWYRTNPLPTACINISLVAIGSTCYALGGYDGSYLNQALYASIDDLLDNAVPANQTTHSGSSDSPSPWKTLPNTPAYQPTAAVLAGNLLAIGGRKKSEGGASKKEIYMYSPSTNSWIYISDLPAQRSGTTVAVLPSTEILVIGGYDGNYVNTVYKGTLTLSCQCTRAVCTI